MRTLLVEATTTPVPLGVNLAQAALPHASMRARALAASPRSKPEPEGAPPRWLAELLDVAERLSSGLERTAAKPSRARR